VVSEDELLPPHAASPTTAAAARAIPLRCFIFIYLLSPYAKRIAIVGSPRRLARTENNTVWRAQNPQKRCVYKKFPSRVTKLKMYENLSGWLD
jgi:hypothetical protein